MAKPPTPRQEPRPRRGPWIAGVGILLLGTVAGGCKSGGVGAGQATALAPAPAAAPSAGEVRDVLLLADPDFVVRSRAAERLVSRGEAALPALGAAGDLPVSAVGGTTVSATEPVVRSILESASYEVVRENLDAPWPVVRRGAAADLGARGRWGAVPALIERLEDPDAQVRSNAHASLRRLTNHSLAFCAGGTQRERAAATARWRAWWNLEGRVRGTGRDAQRSSG